ncbi:MAG: hypothetical protein Q4C71_05410 [Microbacteriaceae bacterium]|nr:hypothetical protein [Microbacteriaceae bacterium]
MRAGYVFALVFVLLAGVAGSVAALLEMPLLHLAEIPLIGLAVVFAVVTFMKSSETKKL